MITNAVIPVAGVGSRMAPITAAVPKALLPLPREDGSWLAVLHHILIEASSAGVSSAGVVVSPGHRPMIEEYLQAASASGPRLPAIELIIQDKPAGFGDAFLQAIDRGLSLQPDDRPRSIADFRAALWADEAAARTPTKAASIEQPAMRDAPAPAGSRRAW